MTSELRELVWVPMAFSLSRTITSRPDTARARATARPITPAPITTASQPRSSVISALEQATDQVPQQDVAGGGVGGKARGVPARIRSTPPGPQALSTHSASERSQTPMTGSCISGWNCTPKARRPSRKAWLGQSRVDARRTAPRGDRRCRRASGTSSPAGPTRGEPARPGSGSQPAPTPPRRPGREQRYPARAGCGRRPGRRRRGPASGRPGTLRAPGHRPPAVPQQTDLIAR